MSYGRGGIDREGIGAWYATYIANAGLKSVAGDGITILNRAAVIGKAVALTAADTVGYGSDGDALEGIITQYDYDGYVTVQVRGYAVDVPVVDGSEPAVKDVVVVNGAGAVKTLAATRYGPKVESVDTAANTCVLFLG
jgi:hypothetical protein